MSRGISEGSRGHFLKKSLSKNKLWSISWQIFGLISNVFPEKISDSLYGRISELNVSFGGIFETGF